MTWLTLFKENKGFTFIEVLIAVFVIGTTMVGLFSLFVLVLQTGQLGERRVIAIALVNERAEMIRNLPYVNVGTVGGIPAGPIIQEEVINRDASNYTVETDIKYFDDEYDGLIPDDTLNLDYKQARIEVSWESSNGTKSVVMLMQIAPFGIEGGEVAGTLRLQVIDANGAGIDDVLVQLTNDEVVPNVLINTQTDSEGKVLLPGLPAGASNYKLAISKAGFTSELTYDVSAAFIPDPDHTHLSSIVGEVTNKIFIIDLLSSIQIGIVDDVSTPVIDLPFTLRGSKTIGVDELGESVYVFDSDETTDALGENTQLNMVWDAYDVIIDGEATDYDIKESSLALPLAVGPGENVELDLTLIEYTEFSLHVTVTDPADVFLEGATVRVDGSGYDEEIVTELYGQSFFSGLPIVGDYQVTVSAPGKNELIQNITVDGSERLTLILTDI